MQSTPITRLVIFAIALLAAAPVARADITMMDQPPRRRGWLVLEPRLAESAGVVSYVRQPLVSTGIALFGVSYVTSVIAAATIDHGTHPGAAYLDAPLVGPWLALANWGHCSAANPGCISTTGDKVWLVADGLVQAAGVITLLDGLFWPRSRHSAQDTSLHVKPTTNGMAIFAHF